MLKTSSRRSRGVLCDDCRHLWRRATRGPHCGGVDFGLDRSRVVMLNRSQDKLRGVVSSLSMWARLIGSSVEVLGNSDLSDEAVDLAVVAVKDAYDPRTLLGKKSHPWLPDDLRHVGIERDIPLLKDVADRLRGFRGPVLVLTNPLDLSNDSSESMPERRPGFRGRTERGCGQAERGARYRGWYTSGRL